MASAECPSDDEDIDPCDPSSGEPSCSSQRSCILGVTLVAPPTLPPHSAPPPPLTSPRLPPPFLFFSRLVMSLASSPRCPAGNPPARPGSFLSRRPVNHRHAAIAATLAIKCQHQAVKADRTRPRTATAALVSSVYTLRRNTGTALAPESRAAFMQNGCGIICAGRRATSLGGSSLVFTIHRVNSQASCQTTRTRQNDHFCF